MVDVLFNLLYYLALFSLSALCYPLLFIFECSECVSVCIDRSAYFYIYFSSHLV